MKNTPKVVIEISHPAHLNFFKNAVSILRKAHHFDVELIVQPRGNLAAIVKKEYPDLSFTSFGRHRNSLFGKALNLLLRDMRLLLHLWKRDFDASAGVQGISTSHVSWLLRKPSVVFDDDAGFKLTYYPYKFFATRIVMPRCIDASGKNIVKYSGFKELAYLHPHYFAPDVQCLDEYHLQPQRYVFIREVTNTTSDYRGLKMGQLSEICPYLREAGFNIVLSLEEKRLSNLFEKECIILHEPVRDIYSLMHFAAFTISSGDTMARESCLVGTPAIYTGRKMMPVNAELEKKGCLFQAEGSQQILGTIKKVLENNLKERTKQVIQEAIEFEWEDTTEVIVNNLLSAMYKDDTLIKKYRLRR